jgi:ABC-type transport system involved in cytochrome bd biosynthesis fused ATPase/permease subunit
VSRRPDDVALSLEDVSMTFAASDGSQPVQALEKINLQIRSGAFVSLIGPSGCGKSTLLRLLGDLLAPSAGTSSAATTRASACWRTICSPLDMVANKPDVVQRFVRASLKGWQSAIDDQAGAVDAVMKYVEPGSTTVDHQTRMMSEVAKLVLAPGMTSDQIGSWTPTASRPPPTSPTSST